MATRNNNKDLTIKQKGFIQDLIKYKSIKNAVKKNYNTKSDRNAGLIGTRMMGQPKIQYAILDLMDKTGISDLRLAEKLKSMIFDSKKEVLTKAGEIVELRDNTSQLKALDMAMKIKGAYAPERHEHLNVSLNIYQDLTDDELNERIKFVEAREVAIAQGEREEIGT